MAEPTRLLRFQEGRVLVLSMASACGNNPVSPELGSAIKRAVADAAADNSVGVIVLTGAGKVFSAGGDINGLIAACDAPRPDAVVRDLLGQSAAASLALMDCPKPTIAMINGAAAGGGLALAAACDLRLAGQSAKFAYAYPRIALAGDLVANWALTRVLGMGRARQFCLSARVLSAAAALDIGLVGEVHADADLRAAVLALAGDMAGMSPMALAQVKTNLEAAASLSREAAVEVEVRGFLAARLHADHREAAMAFIEKRAPRWQ